MLSLWDSFVYKNMPLSNFRITRRYGPLCGPTSSSCGGLQPFTKGLFCPSGKKTNYYAFLTNLRQFWFPVVSLVTLKRIQRIQRAQKNPTKNSINQKKN